VASGADGEKVKTPDKLIIHQNRYCWPTLSNERTARRPPGGSLSGMSHPEFFELTFNIRQAA
jgi:hypothetical protein